jgi:hypothetical protein
MQGMQGSIPVNPRCEHDHLEEQQLQRKDFLIFGSEHVLIVSVSRRSDLEPRALVHLFHNTS